MYNLFIIFYYHYDTSFPDHIGLSSTVTYTIEIES